MVIGGVASQPQPFAYSVPQGSVLGPILSLLYINDIVDGLHSEIRLFADDVLMYSTLKGARDISERFDTVGGLGQRVENEF